MEVCACAFLSVCAGVGRDKSRSDFCRDLSFHGSVQMLLPWLSQQTGERTRTRWVGLHEDVLITSSCTEQLGHELLGQQWEAVKLNLAVSGARFKQV